MNRPCAPLAPRLQPLNNLGSTEQVQALENLLGAAL